MSYNGGGEEKLAFMSYSDVIMNARPALLLFLYSLPLLATLSFLSWYCKRRTIIIIIIIIIMLHHHHQRLARYHFLSWYIAEKDYYYYYHFCYASLSATSDTIIPQLAYAKKDYYYSILDSMIPTIACTREEGK